MLLPCFPWSWAYLFLEWKCGQCLCGMSLVCSGVTVEKWAGACTSWHCVFSMIKVLNKGQITSLALQNKKELDTRVNYSVPLILCNLKSKLNGRENPLFPSYTHLQRDSTLCSLSLLCSHHITFESVRKHILIKDAFCTFQQSWISNELDLAKDVQETQWAMVHGRSYTKWVDLWLMLHMEELLAGRLPFPPAVFYIWTLSASKYLVTKLEP